MASGLYFRVYKESGENILLSLCHSECAPALPQHSILLGGPGAPRPGGHLAQAPSRYRDWKLLCVAAPVRAPKDAAAALGCREGMVRLVPTGSASPSLWSQRGPAAP